MQVTVKYHDTDSLLVEEVIKQAKNNYGNTASVQVAPDSDTPLDLLHFAIERYITGKHITLLYDSGPTYQRDLEKFRSEILYKLGEILDEVIISNENKIA